MSSTVFHLASRGVFHNGPMICRTRLPFNKETNEYKYCCPSFSRICGTFHHLFLYIHKYSLVVGKGYLQMFARIDLCDSDRRVLGQQQGEEERKVKTCLGRNSHGVFFFKIIVGRRISCQCSLQTWSKDSCSIGEPVTHSQTE